jgi:hypothetical protein
VKTYTQSYWACFTAAGCEPVGAHGRIKRLFGRDEHVPPAVLGNNRTRPLACQVLLVENWIEGRVAAEVERILDLH